MAILPRLTYADLASLPEDGKRYELLEGVLFMSPAPSRRHQAVLTQLFGWLFRAQVAGYGQVYVAPTDVVLAEDNVVQPDLFFVARKRLGILADANVQGAPDVVIEILSPTSRQRDLGAKLQIYARFGVPHYLVADPDAATIQPYTLTPAGAYSAGPALRRGDTLSLPLFPEIAVPVTTIFS